MTHNTHTPKVSPPRAVFTRSLCNFGDFDTWVFDSSCSGLTQHGQLDVATLVLNCVLNCIACGVACS